ncbi:MAG: SAM-dependent chlorinase/fluorinase [Nitrospirae bacterium]|nr:SAM-dependent chlorinase/fluorinase [Nitrospirota bacterium]
MPDFITLTTDFGLKDPFAGIMKGVILNINPEVEIIDISHNVSPQNIIEASLILRDAFKFFPEKTIHVAVVDPGVGSLRKPILVVTPEYYFIGPDNGIFSFAYQDEHRVIHITAENYFLKSEDTTFHGRDIFAPVAGWLSKGVTADNFGSTIKDYLKIIFPKPKRISDELIEGEIIYIDNFGNAASNISRKEIGDLTSEPSNLKILIKDKEIKGINMFYAQTFDKGPSAIINSSGLLEIYIYQGNAEKKLGLKRGDKIGVMV